MSPRWHAPADLDRLVLVERVVQVLGGVEVHVEDALPLDAEGVAVEARPAVAARLLHSGRRHACIPLPQQPTQLRIPHAVFKQDAKYDDVLYSDETWSEVYYGLRNAL